MNGSRILDTNAAISLMNKSRDVALALRSVERLYLPLIVIGELEFGARNSTHPQKNLDSIENLLREVAVLSPDRSTAAVYGDIRVRLRRKGRPIP